MIENSNPNKLTIAQADKIISSYSEKDMDELYIHNWVYLYTVKQLADTMRENERLRNLIEEIHLHYNPGMPGFDIEAALNPNKESENG